MLYPQFNRYNYPTLKKENLSLGKKIMQPLPKLQPGDTVEIIAPASRCSEAELLQLKELLNSWDLHCIVESDLFGSDLLCANTDEARFRLLKAALFRPHSKAIICARGGYGCMRLIPKLSELTAPSKAKIVVGMSDITALNLFLQQRWGWAIIHGALTQHKYSLDSITEVKKLLFADVNTTSFLGFPLNELAKQNNITINAPLTGGNLSLIQTSLCTLWQLQTDNKIVFFEDVGERGYRIDRMLEQLEQSGVLKTAQAIVFGDFIEGNEPNGESLVWPVIERFASQSKIPVIRIEGVGHAHKNYPILLGTTAQLVLGTEIQLTCFR